LNIKTLPVINGVLKIFNHAQGDTQMVSLIEIMFFKEEHTV